MKIVVYEAIWCYDCRVMKPMWRNLRLEFPKLIIEEIDYSENDKKLPENIQKYQIHDIPTAIFFDKNNNELSRLTGLRHRDDFIDLINKYKNL